MTDIDLSKRAWLALWFKPLPMGFWTGQMEHEALLDVLYAAASGEMEWKEAVPKALRQVFDGAAVLFADGHVADPTSYDIVESNFCPDLVSAAGFRYDANFDPESNVAFAGCLTSQIARSFSGLPLLEEATPRQLAFFSGCFSANGFAFPYSFTVLRDDGSVAGGFVARSARRGPLDRDEISRLDATLSHLRRAVDLKQRLSISQAATRGIARVVDTLGTAFVLIDRDQRVLFRNEAADALIEIGNGVSVLKERLRLSDKLARRELDRRLANLYAQGTTPVETPFRVTRSGGRLPLAVTVHRTAGLGVPLGAQAAYAAITLADPMDGRSLPSAERIVAALGLTRAEAETVRLIPLGITRRTIATELGVSESTIKTHLDNARAKLGVPNTAALAALIARL